VSILRGTRHPKSRKEREIIERGYLGRIVRSKPPEITYPTP